RLSAGSALPVPDGGCSQWSGGAETRGFCWPGEPPDDTSTATTDLRETAATAVRLQQLLANVYPELARVQRLPG
ncbi:MAG: hypothetical protein ACTS5G_00070, partial [Burkholderiales bacterium]